MLLWHLQFVELKGSVFKRFEKNNLFQMACSGMIRKLMKFSNNVQFLFLRLPCFKINFKTIPATWVMPQSSNLTFLTNQEQYRLSRGVCAFPRVCRGLHVFATSCDWFITLFALCDWSDDEKTALIPEGNGKSLICVAFETCTGKTHLFSLPTPVWPTLHTESGTFKTAG